jgi:hypothetical protein
MEAGAFLNRYKNKRCDRLKIRARKPISELVHERGYQA